MYIFDGCIVVVVYVYVFIFGSRLCVFYIVRVLIWFVVCVFA